MTLTVGLSSPSFCHEDPVDVLRRCHEAGFDVFEPVADGRHALPTCAAALAEARASFPIGLQLHSPIADVNLGSLNDAMWRLSVETVEAALRACPTAGIDVVTLHPGNHSPLSKGRYELLHEATRRALERLEPVAADVGVRLLLENMPTSWAFETSDAERLQDLLRGRDIGFTFDLGHAHVAGVFEQMLDTMGPSTGNVHIHDNQGDFDAHLTLDEGSVPWRQGVSRLLDDGYAGAWIIETNTFDSGVQSLGLLRAFT